MTFESVPLCLEAFLVLGNLYTQLAIFSTSLVTPFPAAISLINITHTHTHKKQFYEYSRLQAYF